MPNSLLPSGGGNNTWRLGDRDSFGWARCNMSHLPSCVYHLVMLKILELLGSGFDDAT